jgi:hypothetical protein
MPIPCPLPSLAEFERWSERRADKTLRAADALPPFKIPAGYVPPTPSDSEARCAAVVESMRAASARARFDEACPPDLHPSRTDWTHTSLAPFAAQIDRVRGWTPEAGAGNGLLLAGPTGRGKSRVFYALAEKLSCEKPRHDVAIWHAHEFFLRLQSQVHFGNDDAAAFVRAVASRPILFIDDLGQEAIARSKADWAEGWLFRLLDIRAGLRLPLFVTTNLTGEQMTGRASSEVRGDPLLRRLLLLAAPVKF